MPPPPLTLTFDRLTVKLVCESHLRWATFVPNLGTLDLWVLELCAMYATDGQTDGRTNGRTKAMLIVPSLWSGHNNNEDDLSQRLMLCTACQPFHSQRAVSNLKSNTTIKAHKTYQELTGDTPLTPTFSMSLSANTKHPQSLSAQSIYSCLYTRWPNKKRIFWDTTFFLQMQTDFQKFFHRVICKKIFYVYITKISIFTCNMLHFKYVKF